MSATVIDVHSHVIIDLGDGLDAGIGAPVSTMPAWSAAGALELMDRTGISAGVLSVPEGAVRHDRDTNRSYARRLNEYLTGLVHDAPGRRGAVATLPAGDIDDALAEVAYALDDLGMDGVCLPTSVHDVNLGDPRYEPLFEEFQRRGVTLFVHPVLPPAAAALDLGLNASILEFPFDTTRTIVNLIRHAVPSRFPDVRIIMSHGGGTFPYLLTRVETLYPVFDPGAGTPGALTAERIASEAARLYYDVTAATAPSQLAALADVVSPEHLLMGFDIPFMPPGTIRPSIVDVQVWPGLDETARGKVLSGNAAALYPALAARMNGSPAHAAPVGDPGR